ncbi:MAG: RNA-binding S4 domain-containing protein [Syntrophomonadaceae bacterium]|jgi:ribosomal 50S subunit-recycling heat shock protein|nr:RNA-binding S4 domain-containing protein [Syntrophomonadaceae bacterium]
MRLDKYLKLARLIKRRSVAKDFIENDRVLVNGRVAKPAYEVKKGDIITLLIGNKQTRVEILDIKENVRASDAKSLYRILD